MGKYRSEGRRTCEEGSNEQWKILREVTSTSSGAASAFRNSETLMKAVQ